MNIGAIARWKLHDILRPDPEKLNQNFDRIRGDIVRMADALNAYKIDLSSEDDIIGNLGVSHLAGGSGASSTTFWRGDGSWADPGGMPIFTTRRWVAFHPVGATVASIGIAAPTETNAGAVVFTNASVFRPYTTTAGAGAKAGHDSVVVVRSGHDPIFIVKMRTGSSLANLRFWFGLSNAGHTNVDTHAGNTISFRYSTVAVDGGWVGVLRNGVTQSVTATVATIATDTDYVLKIRVSGSSAFFSVNGGTEIEATSGLPGSTDLLISNQVFTTEAVAKSWSFARFYTEGN